MDNLDTSFQRRRIKQLFASRAGKIAVPIAIMAMPILGYLGGHYYGLSYKYKLQEARQLEGMIASEKKSIKSGGLNISKYRQLIDENKRALRSVQVEPGSPTKEIRLRTYRKYIASVGKTLASQQRSIAQTKAEIALTSAKMRQAKQAASAMKPKVMLLRRIGVR